MTATRPEKSGALRALVIGVSKFGEADLTPLTFAHERTKEVADALKKVGYDVTVLDTKDGPPADQLANAVVDLLNTAEPDDAVIIHILTHGVISPTGGLILVGSDGTQLDRNRPEGWLRSVEDNLNGKMPRALLFIDACHSGQDARLAWQLNAAHDPRAWVIAGAAPVVAAPKDIAYNGWFTEASAQVLDELKAGHLDVSESVEFVPLDLIARRIATSVLALAQGYPQQVTATAVDIAATPTWPFFKNPRYKSHGNESIEELVPGVEDSDLQLDMRHFLGRARGVELDVDSDRSKGYFVGRDSLLEDLAKWTDGHDDGALRVVTGKAGSGKSAVIGVAVCGLHGPLRAAAQPLLHGHNAFTPTRHLAVVHARGRSTQRVLTSIGKQLGLTQTPIILETLIDWGRKQRRPFLVVVDAVDEAEDPGDLAAALTQLSRARRRRTRGGEGRGLIARVLAGTRSGDQWPEIDFLVREADHEGGLVDLEATSTEQLAYEVKDYVEAVLSDSPTYGRMEAAPIRRRIARDLAAAVTDERDLREWGEFLVASLFVHHALAQPYPASEAELEHLLAQIPKTLAEVLELDLGARLGSTPWVREVLTVLALGGATSMPFEVLANLTGAYMGSQSPMESAAVRQALDAARFYLRRTVETDGTALYRLYHQALIDHLLRRDGVRMSRALRNRELCNRLIASVPTSEGQRVWSAVPPYVWRHLLDWVAASDVTFNLVTNATFLGYAEWLGTASYMQFRPDADVLATRQAYSATTSEVTANARFHLAAPATRLQLLAVNARRVGQHEVATELSRANELSWIPTWATGTVVDGGLRLTPQRAMRIRRVKALGSLVVTAGDDGMLRIWRRSTGEMLAATRFADPDRPPTGLTVSEDRDGAVVYVATRDRITKATVAGEHFEGDVQHLPFKTQAAITELTHSNFRGRRVILVGTSAGRIHLLDRSGNPQHEAIHGTGLISGIAVAPSGSVRRVYSVGFDSALSEWRLSGLVHEGRGEQLHRNGIAAIVALKAPGKRVVTAGFDGKLNLLEPDSRTRLKTVRTGRANVQALLTRDLTDSQQLVVVYRDGVIELRDALTLDQVGRFEVPAPVADAAVLDDGSLTIVTQGDLVRMVSKDPG